MTVECPPGHWPYFQSQTVVYRRGGKAHYTARERDVAGISSLAQRPFEQEIAARFPVSVRGHVRWQLTHLKKNLRRNYHSSSSAPRARSKFRAPVPYLDEQNYRLV